MFRQKQKPLINALLLVAAFVAVVSSAIYPPYAQVDAQNLNGTGFPTLNSNQNESDTLTEFELLDEQAQDTQISQLNERSLRDLIQELRNENVTLEQEILGLANQQEEFTNALEGLQQIRDGQEEGDPFINNLNTEIEQTEQDLQVIATELNQKRAQEAANLRTIELAEGRLDTLNDIKNDDVSSLQSQLIDIFSRYSFYFGLILIYFALQQLLNAIVDRFVKAEIARDIIKFLITFVIIAATVVTLLIAFVGNLTYLLTGLGVISAALVVALQDFVSSLFAFFWIKLRRIYKISDVIDINTGSTGIVTGVVLDIGIFRTTLKELYGEGELNAERSSGRTVSVPNNVILKAPVVNYTHDNRILWHVMSIIITFESDFEMAKKHIENILKKQFSYALDHKDQLLDDAYNLEYVYAPKVFMSIAGSGPQFDIWFAARYGHYREVRESISGAILHSFRTHGIDLAYTTTRIIATPKKDNDNSTIAFYNHGIFDDK